MVIEHGRNELVAGDALCSHRNYADHEGGGYWGMECLAGCPHYIALIVSRDRRWWNWVGFLIVWRVIGVAGV